MPDAALDDRIDAFVSYNRQDQDDVDYVVKELKNRGMRCFIDRDVAPGTRWVPKLQEMIERSETFLFFVRDPPSTWQLTELNNALQLTMKTGKPYIIPVLLPRVSSAAYLENSSLSFLRESQAAHFSQSVKDKAVLDALARAIMGNSRVYISSRAMPREDLLPSGFQADLEHLTELLIGEAVYKGADVCVRELIQNARDACSRLQSANIPGVRTPEIIINIDSGNRYFDVIDFGDGMTQKLLLESFSVLGRSVNDSFHNDKLEAQKLARPVVGKFGIGFISAFMVAERISVSTKAVNEPQYNFTIFDVKQPFQYTPDSQCGRIPGMNGTTMRVYIRPKYISGALQLNIENVVREFCRHVPSLSIFKPDGNAAVESDWNFDPAGAVSAEIIADWFEIRLTWASRNQDEIILSNGGFRVTALGPNVLGEFPRGFIRGEINVVPGFVDLNLARDDVVANAKMVRLRAAIGEAIAILIKKSAAVLESSDQSNARNIDFAVLAAIVRRVSIMAKKFSDAGGVIKLGQIAVATKVDLAKLYADALVALLAIRGSTSAPLSKGGHGDWSYSTLRRALSTGSVAIVYEESFSDRRKDIFSEGAPRRGYISLKADRVTTQLPSQQITFSEKDFIEENERVLKLSLLSEQAAFDRFYGWNSIRGLRQRWPEIWPFVLAAAITVLAIYGLGRWLWDVILGK